MEPGIRIVKNKIQVCPSPSCSTGRKREINIAEAHRPRAQRERRTTQSYIRGSATGRYVTPARKIHIFKYFSHGKRLPRHAALPPTATYLPIHHVIHNIT